MSKIILEYPKKDLKWIPLTEIEDLDNDGQYVLYRYNDESYTHICFRDIFNDSICKDDVLEICLNPKINRYATRYTNLKKYVDHLNTLYSDAEISIFHEESSIVGGHYGLWLRVNFSKDYPDVVLKDICTRIRFLHESPYQNFMDEVLFKEDFILKDIERKVSTLGQYEVNTGHYLFSDKNYIMRSYKNYEERILKVVDDHNCQKLHTVLNKIKND